MQPTPITSSTLYYGDNLFILRDYVPNESVDLIYLDPPFNSARSYNVLFKDEKGKEADAQLMAFEDAWQWTEVTEQTYHQVVTTGPARLVTMIGALKQGLGTSEMMAYLVMMAARLVELHRVLKPTGSIWLHCDPTASHYLRVILDSIFGSQNFRNEIIWKRTSAHNTTSKKFGDITDTILFYTKSNKYFFEPPRTPHDETYVKKFYRFQDEQGRRYRLHQVERNAALGIRPNLIYVYNGYTPTYGWMMEKPKLEELDRQGKLVWSSNGRPGRKIFLDEVELPPIGNLWDDIQPIQAQAAERLGYPTQKPLTLLERIICAGTKPGDVVLDPFAGCGTTIAAAQKLNRTWLGIDVTYLAIKINKERLEKMYPDIQLNIIGDPKDLADAHRLAQQDRYQFQWWAIDLIPGSQLVGVEPGSKKGKKGADRGIDGLLYFLDEIGGGKPKKAILQVKSGKVSVRDIRDLAGTVEREQAQFGLFITLEKPTSEMCREALEAGRYYSPGWKRDYPKIQILTIDELLHGGCAKMPPTVFSTYKQAKRVEQAEGTQGELAM